jgi:hypothetical protein
MVLLMRRSRASVTEDDVPVRNMRLTRRGDRVLSILFAAARLNGERHGRVQSGPFGQTTRLAAPIASTSVTQSAQCVTPLPLTDFLPDE